MAGQVDQDVDPVLAHPLGQLRMGEPASMAPDIHHALELLGGGIRETHVRIGVDFEVAMLVMAQQRQDEGAAGVEAEVRRHIADPQPPRGPMVVGIGAVGRLRIEVPGDLQVAAQHLAMIEMRMVVQGEQVIAVEAAAAVQMALQQAHGLLDAQGGGIEPGQVDERAILLRPLGQLDGALERLLRLDVAHLVQQGHAQHVPAAGAGLDGQRRAGILLRQGRGIGLDVLPGQLDPAQGLVRRQGDGPLQAAFGIHMAGLQAVHQAEVAPATALPLFDPQGLEEALLGLLQLAQAAVHHAEIVEHIQLVVLERIGPLVAFEGTG